MHLWHDEVMAILVATMAMVSPHVCPARVLETPLEMPLAVCMLPTVKYFNRWTPERRFCIVDEGGEMAGSWTAASSL